MEDKFWRLPGPSRFIDGLVDAFRAGKSMLILLPSQGPPTPRHTIRDAIESEELGRWKYFDLSDPDFDIPPVELLHREIAPLDDAVAMNVRTLIESVQSYVVWVDGISEANWDIWRHFLDDYSHACRAVEPWRRSLFCIPLSGTPSKYLPKEDATLGVTKWRGVVNRFDMASLVSQLMSNDSGAAWKRNTAVAVAVELAGTDPHLASNLARSAFRDILAPMPILRSYALGLGWTEEAACAADWEAGLLDDVDGRPFVHSAALSLGKNTKEIDRRVWNGQVSTIFPLLERERVALLNEVGRHLHVPTETPFGTIHDVRDFELGQIWARIRNSPVRRSTVRYVESLTEMRHALAHLEPISADTLLSPEVARRIK